MTSDAGLLLQNQAMRMVLDPLRGAAIRELLWRGRPLLRTTPDDAGDDPFDTACFPMAPYANRVAHGRFIFDTRTVQLARNWSRDPHPLHGQAWRAAWSVVRASETDATLLFEGGGDDWPWRYACEQRCQLLENGLLIDLSIRNAADSPMPAMLGLHPYFPDAAHARLEAVLPRVWLTDSEVLPVKEVATPAAWRFEPGRDIRAVPLDHSFCGWDGVATVRWPDLALAIHAPGCRFLHVYAPAGGDFFCLEPQSGPPGALGRNPREATILNPGERFDIQVRFEAGAS